MSVDPPPQPTKSPSPQPRYSTLAEARQALRWVRDWHPNPPQNGSQSDVYNLLADIVERYLNLGPSTGPLPYPALHQLPARPDRCPSCTCTPGTNWGCNACAVTRGLGEIDPTNRGG